MIRGLKHFQFRGTDVIVFQILDPDELEFPFERATRFEDLETAEEVMAVPAMVRDHYLQAIGGPSRPTSASWARPIDYLRRPSTSRSSSRSWPDFSTRGRAL